MDLNEMLSEINETCSRAWLNVVFFFLVNFFLFSDKIHVYIYDKKNEREFRIIYQLISANVLEWIKSEKKDFHSLFRLNVHTVQSHASNSNISN